MPLLGAAAQATTTIRLGTFVLNSDMRNPVQLAWEASTLDQLSNGRFELGLGAGHTPHEYAETGIELLGAKARKSALRERVEIISRLLNGESVDFHGQHHQLEGATIDPSSQKSLPLLVGGNGAALLSHAARHADIIGLQGLGRTLEDGHRHSVRWASDHLDRQVEQVTLAAGDRLDHLELNALVQFVDITRDAAESLAKLTQRVEGLTSEHIRETPYALVGTVDEIISKIKTCQRRWGISYFVVRELDAFAPVIEAFT